LEDFLMAKIPTYEELEQRVKELETKTIETKLAEEVLKKRLATLTMPRDDAKPIIFEDLFNLEDIQRLQDEFASATGVASIITHTDGTPITRPSHFCRLCKDIIRKTRKGRANCYESDAVIGRLSPEGPTIQPCMSGGLWDAGAGISVGGRHIANWLIGQVRDATQTEDKMRAYALEIGADESALIQAFREVPSMSRERFAQIARVLFTLSNQLSTIAYQNLLQARFITERKQAEEALRESEGKYRTILEDIEDGYFEVDIAGNLTFFNGSLSEILGYSKDELIGMSSRQYTDEENAKKLYQTFNRVYTTGKSDKGFDWEIIRKDGNKRIVQASISPKKDSEGQPIGFQGIVRDVSDRRQIEKDKAKLETRLQRAQKMEAIGALAGGVAHDLNNILGGLVSYPELLLLQLSEDSPLRKSILTIQKSGEKAAAVVQDLLTLARRGVVITEVVNLNDVISQYLKSPEYERLQFYHPGVHLETHFDPETLNILGSPTHLSKAVMNLISNAAEAMPEGGKLTVSTENRYIDRPIRGYDNVKEGDYVVLTVSDTGTGIAPDDLEKIFEPFYTKKKMGRSGTGLGMAVVWGTVKDHNGYIHVQSTEGKGTTFTLYFPVTREKLPEDKSHLSIGSYSGNGESIMVVDDVEEQRKIASGMLEELGYSVVSMSSGEEAVEYLKTNKVELLVLDMIMDPGMDGLDTYKKIIEMHPEQKAIIASGFSETGRVKEVQGLGAGAYIRKPFLLEKIGLAVKEELVK
jgi:PAS domain S-box-containing protein